MNPTFGVLPAINYLEYVNRWSFCGLDALCHPTNSVKAVIVIIVIIIIAMTMFMVLSS